MSRATRATIELPRDVEPAFLDDAQYVHVDRKCANCGYNVRTLHVTARCPECNHPVIESVRKPQLFSAHQAWLSNIGGGGMALTAALGAFIFGIAFAALSALGEQIGLSGTTGETEGCVLIPIAVMCPLVALVGLLLLLTAREPEAKCTGPAEWLRWFLRVVLTLLVVSICLLVVASVGATMLYTLAVTVTGLCLLLLWTLLPRHAAHLFARMDDEVGVRRSRRVENGTWITGLLMIAWGAGAEHFQAGSWWVTVLLVPLLALAVAHLRCYVRLWSAADRIVSDVAALHQPEADDANPAE